MTRKSIVIIAASHLLVILAGVLLARQPGAGGTNGTSGAETGVTKAQKPGMPGRDSPRAVPGIRPSKEWRGGEFARAWKAVRTARLTTPERVKAQRDLLKRWAEVDLTAAIEASMGEAWDDDQGQVFGGGAGPLMGVFSEAFAKNPEESWDMIRGRQFGVATGILRSIWIEAVGAENPLFLAARIGELSWRDREEALNACQIALDPLTSGTTREAAFKILARLPEDVVTTHQLLLFASPGDGEAPDPAALKDEILQMGSGDERLAKVKAMMLGFALASKPPEEIAAEIQSLPGEIARETLWASFMRSKKDGMLGTLDLLIEHDAWAKVEQRETVGRLQMLARDGGAEAVADWAATMPVRKETTELFYRSVETYLRESPDESRAWIAGIPNPEWRDRAYAEYSQQSLNARNDPEASRWALDRIGDAVFKREAESWRSQWEKRSGGKGN